MNLGCLEGLLLPIEGRMLEPPRHLVAGARGRSSKYVALRPAALERALGRGLAPDIGESTRAPDSHQRGISTR